MNRHQKHLYIDLSVIAVSFALAYFLARSGGIEQLVNTVQVVRPLGSFIAGVLFVSVFTVAPATTLIVEIAQSNHIYLDALYAACGAVIGDLIIFRFARDRFGRDIHYVMRRPFLRKLLRISRKPHLRWLFVIIGALVVASPFPDEVGIFLMGFSKMRTAYFLPLSFVLNFLGILAIAAIGKAVAS